MATLNTFRGLLVAGAALAVVVAVAYQQWAAAGILTLGILAHIALWVRIHRERVAGGTGAQATDGGPARSGEDQIGTPSGS